MMQQKVISVKYNFSHYIQKGVTLPPTRPMKEMVVYQWSHEDTLCCHAINMIQVKRKHHEHWLIWQKSGCSCRMAVWEQLLVNFWFLTAGFTGVCHSLFLSLSLCINNVVDCWFDCPANGVWRLQPYKDIHLFPNSHTVVVWFDKMDRQRLQTFCDVCTFSLVTVV